jgi:hypothetical protein
MTISNSRLKFYFFSSTLNISVSTVLSIQCYNRKKFITPMILHVELTKAESLSIVQRSGVLQLENGFHTLTVCGA